MAVLRYLNVQLKLLADDFNNKIKAAQKEAKEFEKVVKPTKDLLKDMGTVMVAAGAAVVTGMVAMTKSAANYGEELYEAKQRTGATVQELARLRFAAEQSGASFGDLTNGLRVLARNLDDAAKGSKAQIKLFKDLGIAVQDSRGQIRPLNDVLLDLADKFSKMSDGATKAAIAEEVFGRAGKTLIPTLNLGRDGLEKMGDQAQRLGRVITDEAAKAGEDFNDTLDEIKAAVMGLSTAVGSALLPTFTSMAGTLRDGVIAVKDFAAENRALTQATLAAGGALLGSGGLLLGLTKLVSMVGSVKVGLTALSVAMGGVLGPAGIAVAGTVIIAGLVAAFIRYKDATRDVTERLNAMKKSMDETVTAAQKLADVGDAVAKSNGRLRIDTDALNAMIANTRKEAESTAKSQAALGSISVQAGKSLSGMTVDLKSGAIAFNDATMVTDRYTNSLIHTKEAAEKLKKELADWNELQQAQEEMFQQTLDIIGATNQAREENAQHEFDRIQEERRAFLAQHEERLRIWRAEAQEKEDIDDYVAAQFHKIQQSRMASEQRVIDMQDEVRRESAEKSVRLAEQEAKKLQQAWTQALGNVTSGFADALTDVIFKTRKFSDAMTSLMKTTAKSMLNAMLVGFLSPLTEKLAGLGSGLSGALGGLLGGGGGSAASSAVGSAGGLGSAAISSGAGIAGTAIQAAASIGGGIISAIGSMRLEGTMNAVEYNTRASEIHQRVMIDHFFHPWTELFKKMAGVSAVAPATASAAPVQITINLDATKTDDPIDFSQKVISIFEKAVMTGGLRQKMALAMSQNQGITASYPVG